MTPSVLSSTRDVLVFEHIPKTAGTTLQHVLRRQYGDGLFRFHNMNLELGKPQHRFEKLAGLIQSGQPPRAIISHVGYGLHEQLPEPPEGPLRYTHFTLLRNPIERTISYYYYDLQEGRLPEGTSLVEFCTGDPFAVYLKASNVQTAFLAGLRAEYVLGGRTPRPEDYDEALLERAKRNLDAFVLVGLAERFDESLLLLGDALGWALPSLRFAERNKGKRRPKRLDLSPEERHALTAANALDLELYRYAEGRFEQTLGERMPDLAGRLEALGRVNRLYRPLAPVEYGLQQLKARAHRALRAR